MIMSNANKRMVERLFNNPVTGVVRIAVDRASKDEEQHAKLLCAVIESGFKELDIEYIEGEVCKEHCSIVFVDYKYILYAFNKLRYYVENNIDWPNE